MNQPNQRFIGRFSIVNGDYMSPDPMCFKQFVNAEEKEPRVIRR